MKYTDIAKIRHLLKSILLIYGGNNYQLGEWTKEALALLPCETCDGSGKKPCFPNKGNTVVLSPKSFEIPCPDCGKKPEGISNKKK